MSIFIKFKRIVVNTSTVVANLKVWWRFNVRPLIVGDEGKRAWDSSNNGFHGVVYSGHATTFNGTNTEINIGNINQSIKSISFWVKPSTSTEKILDLDGGTTIVEIVAGVLTYSGFTNATPYVNGINDNVLTAGEWQLVVISSTDPINVSAFKIGVVGSDYFAGDLCGLKLWSISLPPSTVANQYNNPERLTPPGSGPAYLVGFWPLVENLETGLAFDQSGNNNHGIQTGVVAFTDNQTGVIPQLSLVDTSHLLFNNGSSFVNVANDASLDNTTSLTVAMWFVRNENTATNRGLYVKNPANTGIQIKLNGSNLTVAGGGATTLTVADFAAIGELFHLVVTVDTTATIYKNGVSVGSGPIDSMATFGGSLNIGSFADNTTTNPFNGVIFAAAEWSTVLNVDQITALSNGTDPAAISFADLQGYWQNKGVNNWVDLSQNDNTGSPTGGTLETFVLMEGKTTGKTSFGFPLTDIWANVSKHYGNQYAVLPSDSNLELVEPLTWVCWVKHQTPDVAQTVFEKSGSYKLEILANNTFQFTLFHSGGSTIVVNPDTELTPFYWIHFVATFDGENVAVYLDSLMVENQTHVVNLDTNSNDIYTGSASGPTGYLNGYFDEFKILCKTWDSGDVLNEYTETEPQHQNIITIGGLIIGDPGADFGLGDPGGNIFLGNN